MNSGNCQKNEKIQNTTAVLNELKKVIVGKDEILEKVFMAILSGGHVLLEDNPGVGKTTLALAFSKVLGMDYKRMQFTSDSIPSDVTGYTFYDRQKEEFLYREGAVMTNFLLADEINRTSSRTQSALLEVMEEGQVTVDAVTYQVPSPFVVMATQNPAGTLGTQMLPAAQLDRFMVRLHMGYPDFRSQVELLKSRHHENPLDKIKTVIDTKDLLAMQQEAANIHVEDVIYEYITHLAEATRSHAHVSLGLSPRGMLALAQMAKSHAYVRGREYVILQDVQEVFLDVVSHRIILNTKAKIAEETEEKVLEELVKQVPVPLWKGKEQQHRRKIWG